MLLTEGIETEYWTNLFSSFKVCFTMLKPLEHQKADRIRKLTLYKYHIFLCSWNVTLTTSVPLMVCLYFQTRYISMHGSVYHTKNVLVGCTTRNRMIRSAGTFTCFPLHRSVIVATGGVRALKWSVVEQRLPWRSRLYWGWAMGRQGVMINTISPPILSTHS